MLNKTITYLFIVIGFFSTVSSKELGPDVSVYKGQMLKWEDYKKGYNYHVMFRSLLADEKTCLSEVLISSYTLDPSHVPSDAFVKRAFLVWTGAQPIDKIDEIADNQVVLNFESSDRNIQETQTVTTNGHKVTEPQGFEFDSFIDPDDSGRSYFTYRVDVTEFFKVLHEKGRESGYEYDGYSLYGNYKITGFNCANDQIYLENGELVSGWAIILIYRSIETRPRAIYFYDGLNSYKNETAETYVSGFEFISDPKTQITLLSYGGQTDSGNEGLEVRGGDNADWIPLSNKCNPESDVFNSISSVYGWADKEPECIGGTPDEYDPEMMENSMDVDTFVMNSATDGSFSAHFNEGGTEINIRIGANQDRIFTNMLIVSTDPADPTPDFHIPGQPEMIACTPTEIPFNPYSLNGSWCYGELEYTFVIRLQNWGEKASPPVSVQTLIPTFMEYVPESTEYANKFKVVNGKLNAEEWFSITDSEDNGFPLINSTQVAEKIIPNEDTVFVRFRTKVKDTTPKNEVFELNATISAEGYPSYRTNYGIPVKLVYSDAGCVEKQEDVDLSECGGTPETTDEQPDTDSDPETDEDAIISEKENSSGCGCSLIY
jgi:hypothetical protein